MDRLFLECRECKMQYETSFKYVCDECFGPLDVRYNFPSISKDTFAGREQTYWRYFEMLPIENKSQHSEYRRRHDSAHKGRAAGRGAGAQKTFTLKTIP